MIWNSPSQHQQLLENTMSKKTKLLSSRNLTRDVPTMLEKPKLKTSPNSSKENPLLSSLSSPMKLPPRSSVEISNLIFSCSSARKPKTSKTPSPHSPPQPKTSKEKFFSCTSTSMWKTTNVSWNSSPSTPKTAQLSVSSNSKVI